MSTHEVGPDPDAETPSAGEAEGLYPGDKGTLPLEARRLLVQLLAGPSLDARRHPQLWPVLSRYEADIRSRLADLFLELVLDSDMGVAFVRQADTGELEAPVLLRRTPLTFLESALLLYLRGLLAQADVRGERAVVSLEEMMEQMKLYERNLNTDRAGFEKRARAAIEKVKRNSLLSGIRGSEERYEIAPTLKLLFSADEVAALRQRFSAMRA
ncbi:MAG: DUF4194 domain-containing protein, partial [Gammaproteobacteria bacterium]|nr:DUF4194 domain-containing protein [Gammaproteobacteria bacterium]NIR97471.1 DUF4194 domain-containing protein [Gammaproteobacteria bacterium]NIT63100.1 DUF4194 domain-containing protein [Gammaproteobacteria bacterium]NIV20058.1 DUF4194 domain-containing protein [Gammaproteobacteria bacterium]NIY31680.1 DUF4194 domain-containing protein [Gammaproteobacteria bacterium]